MNYDIARIKLFAAESLRFYSNLCAGRNARVQWSQLIGPLER